MSAPQVTPTGRGPRNAQVANREAAVYKDALAKGAISQDEYNTAMGYNDQRLKSGQDMAPSPKTVEYEASQKYYSELGYPQYGGVYKIPTVPAGMEVAKITEKTAADAPLAGITPSYGRPDGRPVDPRSKQLSLTLMPEIKQVYTNTSFFGVIDTRPPTPKEKQQLRERYLRGEDVFMTAEDKALVGLGMATVILPTVTASSVIGAAKYAAGAVVPVAAGEAYKYKTTGQHLTPMEGVMLAGLGQAAVGGASTVAKIGGGKVKETLSNTGSKIRDTVSPGRAQESKLYSRVVAPKSEVVVGQPKQPGPQTAAVGSKSWLEAVRVKVQPERGVYNRAVASVNQPEAVVGSPSFLDRVTRTFNPQRGVYDRVVKSANKAPRSGGSFDMADIASPRDKSPSGDFKITTFNKKSKSFVGKGLVNADKPTSQGWTAGQTRFRKAPTNKRPMKEFDTRGYAIDTKAGSGVVLELRSAGKTIGATKPKPVAKGTKQTPLSIGKIQTEFESTAIATRQQNPFLTFPGKAFPGIKGRNRTSEDETTFANTPPNSPLSSPKLKDMVKTVSAANAKQGITDGLRIVGKNKGKMDAISGVRIVWDLTSDTAVRGGHIQDQGQNTRLVQGQAQDTRQIQKMAQETRALQKNTLKMSVPSFDIGQLGGSSFVSHRRRGYRQRTRIYPIVTGKQFLALEYGQVGKGLIKKSKHKTTKGKRKK